MSKAQAHSRIQLPNKGFKDSYPRAGNWVWWNLYPDFIFLFFLNPVVEIPMSPSTSCLHNGLRNLSFLRRNTKKATVLQLEGQGRKLLKFAALRHVRGLVFIQPLLPTVERKETIQRKPHAASEIDQKCGNEKEKEKKAGLWKRGTRGDLVLGPGLLVWLGVVLPPGWRMGSIYSRGCRSYLEGSRGTKTLLGRREILMGETPRLTTAAATVLSKTHLEGHSELHEPDNPKTGTAAGARALAVWYSSTKWALRKQNNSIY